MFISVETLPIFFTCVFIFFQPMNFEDAVQELLADQLGSWIGLIDLKTIIGACEEVKSNPTFFFPANTWILKFFLLSCFFPINMQLLDNIYGWLNLLLEFKCDHFSTLKPRYNKPQYSEFCDIVKKTQLPFCGFTKHILFDIVNYSI